LRSSVPPVRAQLPPHENVSIPTEAPSTPADR
jgi:hypothetical protein